MIMLDKNIENLKGAIKTSGGSEYKQFENQLKLTELLTKIFQGATNIYRDHKRKQIST